MNAITMLYHDVVEAGEEDASGFPGSGAAPYKLERRKFDSHIEAIAEAIGQPPKRVTDLPDDTVAARPLLLTFDDGGVSAVTHTADRLEKHGWRGHFLVTVDFIGTHGFLTADDIRDLHRRGHVIGTHSCSHPDTMSWRPWRQLVEEWDRSVQVLSEVIGEPVTVGSVPGGYYSKVVARSAARAGVKVLFTSEPITRSHTVAGCVVLGRYTIWRVHGPATAAGIAAGRLAPRLKQYLIWNIKKVAKKVGGRFYLDLRERLLARR